MKNKIIVGILVFLMLAFVASAWIDQPRPIDFRDRPVIKQFDMRYWFGTVFVNTTVKSKARMEKIEVLEYSSMDNKSWSYHDHYIVKCFNKKKCGAEFRMNRYTDCDWYRKVIVLATGSNGKQVKDVKYARTNRCP